MTKEAFEALKEGQLLLRRDREGRKSHLCIVVGVHKLIPDIDWRIECSIRLQPLVVFMRRYSVESYITATKPALYEIVNSNEDGES